MKIGKFYTRRTMDTQTGEMVTETVEVVSIETETILDGPEITFANVRHKTGEVVSIPDNHWSEYTEVK